MEGLFYPEFGPSLLANIPVGILIGVDRAAPGTKDHTVVFIPPDEVLEKREDHDNKPG